MPVFVFLCLAIAGIVQINSPIQNFLVSEFVIDAGLVIAVLTIIASFFNKFAEHIRYDAFSSSALIVWFAYWKPLFVKDSPIFFFFPVYFALMIAFVALFFIGKRDKIDKESLKLMKSIADSGMIQTWVVMVCVLISLYFEDHFLQYPVMMTLLSIRYTLSGCLKPK
jgi:hypothetical protein